MKDTSMESKPMTDDIIKEMEIEYNLLNAGNGGHPHVIVAGINEIKRLRKELEDWKETAWLGYRVVNNNWEPTQFSQQYEEMVEKYGSVWKV